MKDFLKLDELTGLLSETEQKLNEAREARDLIEKSSTVDVRNLIRMFSLASPQAKAPKLERMFGEALGWEKMVPSANRGDFHDQENGVDVELKISFTNKSDMMNARQIRLWQNCDYLLVFIDETNIDDSKFWYLTHDQMVSFVNQYGTACHGTKTANADNMNVEMGFKIPASSSILDAYLRDDLKNIILQHSWEI